MYIKSSYNHILSPRNHQKNIGIGSPAPLYNAVPETSAGAFKDVSLKAIFKMVVALAVGLPTQKIEMMATAIKTAPKNFLPRIKKPSKNIFYITTLRTILNGRIKYESTAGWFMQ